MVLEINYLNSILKVKVMTQTNIPIAEAIPVTTPDQTVYPSAMLSQPYIETGFAGTDEMCLTWRLGKTVRFFALVDVFFCFLSFLQYPPLLAIAVFPLLGYYGAKEYNTWKIYCYAFFVFVNLGLRVYVYTLSQTIGGLLITILGIVVQFWILRIVYRFINTIKRLPIDQLTIIRDPRWEPIQTHLVWG
jgi:hypothetical protein